MTNSPESQPGPARTAFEKRLKNNRADCDMLLSFPAAFYGFCIGGLVLKEPDICFLLGGGRWIVEHGHLPGTDPFSYTTHFHPVPYVIEKWLTEVVFYGIEKSLGLTALLIFDGLILALAFVIVPYRIVHLCGIKGGAAMRMVCLSLLASMSHLAVRPEIFLSFSPHSGSKSSSGLIPPPEVIPRSAGI